MNGPKGEGRLKIAVLTTLFLILLVILMSFKDGYVDKNDNILTKILTTPPEPTNPLVLQVQSLSEQIGQIETAYHNTLTEIERLEQERKLSQATRQQITSAINKFLNGKMKNKGNTIYMAAKSQQPELSATLLTAIILLESGSGFDSYNVRVNNNVSGMNWTSDSRYRRNGWYVQYDNVDQSIWDMAERLSKYYIAQGLTTIEQIGAKYAPLSDPREGMYGMSNAKWVFNVTRIYNQVLMEVLG
jgi:hypothetical protein